MNCSKAQILISAALDEELAEREQRALDRHLESCAGCRESSAAFTTLSEVMSTWQDEEPSPWLAQNFACKLADMQKADSRERARPRWLWGAVTAGVATTVLAFGLLLHSQFAPLPNVTEVGPVVVAPERQAVAVPEDQPAAPVERDTASGETGPVAIAVNPPASNRIETAPKRRPGKQAAKPIAPMPAPAVAREEVGMASTNGIDRASFGKYVPPASRHMSDEEKHKLVAGILAEKLGTIDMTSAVTKNLNMAGDTIDETFETVRGNLRMAADVLSAARVEGTPNAIGGKSL